MSDAKSKRSEYNRQYRQKHKERLAEKQRQWREANKKKVLEYGRKYSKTYRRKNPNRGQEYYAKHKHRLKKWMRKWYLDLKHDAIVAYGGKCACCGESHECFLTIDHVRNDGAAHRREMRVHGGCGIYQWLRNNGYPNDGAFQVLCYNCNCSKQNDPIGHRAAHPNAANIDGLGDLELLVQSGRRSQKSVKPTAQQELLWGNDGATDADADARIS